MKRLGYEPGGTEGNVVPAETNGMPGAAGTAVTRGTPGGCSPRTGSGTAQSDAGLDARPAHAYEGAMSVPLVLYGDDRWESPYVFSSFVAVREKGVAFELRTMSLHSGEHRRGTYPALSMTGRVPALQHGDFWLAESSAIDEYLEDMFPPPRWPRIYPESTRDRARARQVQAWLRTDLAAIRDERDVATVFGAATTAPLSGLGAGGGGAARSGLRPAPSRGPGVALQRVLGCGRRPCTHASAARPQRRCATAPFVRVRRPRVAARVGSRVGEPSASAHVARRT